MIELADLLAAMAPAGARLVGSAAATRFDGFAYDSRKLLPGEVFVAVRTARADGHDFIPDAVARGATAVIGDRLVTTRAIPGVTSIAVDDTLLALQAWAKFALQRYAPTVVAIVGNVGKTSAGKATVAVLGHGLAGDPAVFDGDNHNTLYGLSIALGRLTAAHRVAVVELAPDEPGDLLRLADLTRPTIGVIVGAFDEEAANAELVDFLAKQPTTGSLVVNADDDGLARLLAQRETKRSARLVRYSRTAPADVWSEEARFALDHTEFVLRDRDAAAEPTRLRLLGAPAVAAALASAAVGKIMGLVPDEIVAGLERLEPLSGRLRPLPGLHESLILDDSFDASRPSFDAALQLLERSPRRKTIVLGELTLRQRELARDVYRTLGVRAMRSSDRLVTLGPAPEAAALAALTVGGTRGSVVTTDSAADAIAATAQDVRAADTILVIGGAEARMERVVEGLLANRSRVAAVLVRQDAGWKQRVFLSRERPTWLEVDLAAIGENVRRLREIARPAALMAVLKADAYGHGAVRVARTSLLHGADYLATACLSEAIALRQHAIAAPILILGYTPPWQADEIVRYDLTATAFAVEPVRHLARAARSSGRKARIHVKVDTGMGRLGLLPPDVPGFLEAIRDLGDVEIEGIYTHFACADAADPTATRAQIQRFDQVLGEVIRDGWTLRYVHAANSAGILSYPEARYTMVRAGIALYGLDPSDAVRCPTGFRPSLTFKTLVAQVKDLPPGSPISYGGTFVTARASRIAILPVGYGDGFRRSPGNWGDVLVRGERAPIVGVVCMDMAMIDVTDIPGVRAGDEVVLIGRQGAEEITVADVARKLGTISYEVITQILARVPREVPPGA